MLNDITAKESIVAYNQSFEMSRIKELAKFKPGREEELLALNERFVDLIVPFRGRGYYHPDFNGSFSIKSPSGIIPRPLGRNLMINYINAASDEYTNIQY